LCQSYHAKDRAASFSTDSGYILQLFPERTYSNPICSSGLEVCNYLADEILMRKQASVRLIKYRKEHKI